MVQADSCERSYVKDYSQQEVADVIKHVLVDALGLEDGEVTSQSSLKRDLGVESIDYLDITFRLEKAFSIDPKNRFVIPRGDLFPDQDAWVSFSQDPLFVKDGMVTNKGFKEIQKFAPYADLYEFRKEPWANEAEDVILTVGYIERYICQRLKAEKRLRE
ncbi:MAG: acpP 3 [Candidatus Paceibacter sp.]|jgi:acyl carrier protein|nr:acpP 3 [Candidatus Paceibacter sp.]